MFPISRYFSPVSIAVSYSPVCALVHYPRVCMRFHFSPPEFADNILQYLQFFQVVVLSVLLVKIPLRFWRPSRQGYNNPARILIYIPHKFTHIVISCRGHELALVSNSLVDMSALLLIRIKMFCHHPHSFIRGWSKRIYP